MKKFFAALVVVICVSGTVSAADKQLLGLMMPEAKVLGGMNVLQVRSSPYGQYLLTQGPFNDPQFQQFVQATGFDPLNNITEIVAATPGVPGDNSGLAAVRGTFNVAQIVAFVKTTGGTVDESQGAPLILSPDKRMAIALVDSTLAVAGDTNSVIAALARRSAPSALDPALVAKATTLSVTADAWAVTTINPGSVGLQAGKGPNGVDLSALQNIQQSSAGVKFGTSVNVTAEVVADTPQNADMLASLLRLVVQMAQLNPNSAEIATLTQSLAIKTDGSAIEVSLSIPEDLLEQLSPAHHRVRTRKVAVGRK